MHNHFEVMLQHNIFRPHSPERMDTGGVALSPEDRKPLIKQIAGSKSSDFSIDHILNSAGSTKDSKCMTNYKKSPMRDMRKMYDEANGCFLMDNNSHQFPPILDWLQYTRYKPPRLPSKKFFKNGFNKNET